MLTKPELIHLIKNNKKLLILAITGVVLLFTGNAITNKDKLKTNEVSFTENELINEAKLEKILSNIEGAGKVRVFISYENNGVYEYAVDSKTTKDNSIDEKKHVFSNKEPVIKSFINAQIRGIIVTATGAYDNNVKNRLFKSIKAATGVGLDKINIEIGVR